MFSNREIFIPFFSPKKNPDLWQEFSAYCTADIERSTIYIKIAVVATMRGRRC